MSYIKKNFSTKITLHLPKSEAGMALMEYYIFFWDEKNCSENDNCDLSTLCQNICYLVFCNLGTMYILKGSLNRWIYSVIIFSCCIVYPEISCISLGEKNEMNILKMFSQYSRVPNKSFYAAWQILFKTVLYCVKLFYIVFYFIHKPFFSILFQ
jgi:hypothetical protein